MSVPESTFVTGLYYWPLLLVIVASNRYWYFELSAYRDSLRTEHLAIAEAIKAGDSENAGAEMREHLTRGLQVNTSANVG